MSKPPIEDTAIAVLLEALPELGSLYADLAEDDEDPSPQLVFAVLAEQVGTLLRAGEDGGELERIFAAIERVVETPGIDLVESVAFGFIDSLPMELGMRASAYFGPETERLAQRLDSGEFDVEAELLELEDYLDEEDIDEERLAQARFAAERLAEQRLGASDLGAGDLGKSDLGKSDLGAGDLGKGDLDKGDLYDEDDLYDEELTEEDLDFSGTDRHLSNGQSGPKGQSL